MELATARPASSGELTLSGRARDGASGRHHGPLKVTDPVVFQRMLDDMRAKAEEQKALAAKREAERVKREGSDAFVAQRVAGDGDSSNVRKVDASRDYYATLGVDSCASVAEIRAAYKKLALLYHPDKHKAEDAAQQAAVADKFREAAEAFEVLVDERTRAVYDKVRDYQGANPGRGLPSLTPEEAALMAAGAAELRRLRRLGAKHAKHAPSVRSVTVTLGELHTGCMKTVAFSRRRVDEHGIEHDAERNFYLVVRRGSRAGDVLTFEGEGDETVDTQPGDLLVRLAAAPHAALRPVATGSGKDLEFFGGLLPRTEFFAAVEAPTPAGGTRLVAAAVLRDVLASGGAGGSWRTAIRGQGLFDHGDPWGKPAGDLHVTVRYPALRWAQASVDVALAPGPVLLGAHLDALGWGLVSGLVAERFARYALLRDVLEDEDGASARGAGKNNFGRVPRPSTSINVFIWQLASSASCKASARGAAEALMRALRIAPSPGIRLPRATCTVASGAPLLDDEIVALQHADIVVLLSDESGEASHPASSDWQGSPELAAELRRLHCAGASLVGVGSDAARLLGQAGALPWYRAVGGEADGGWRALYREAARQETSEHRLFVGVPAGAVCEIDPGTGRSRMLVSPPTKLLVAAASWEGDEDDRVSEALDTLGFFTALERA